MANYTIWTKVFVRLTITVLGSIMVALGAFVHIVLESLLGIAGGLVARTPSPIFRSKGLVNHCHSFIVFLYSVGLLDTYPRFEVLTLF